MTVTGTTVKITVLADGPRICNPAQTGDEPVKWAARYDLRAEYKRRVQATIRVFYESYLIGARWQLRPTTISDGRRGAATRRALHGHPLVEVRRHDGDRHRHAATGLLPPRRQLPHEREAIRLVASKPDYCADSGKIEYLRLSIYLGKIEQSGLFIT